MDISCRFNQAIGLHDKLTIELLYGGSQELDTPIAVCDSVSFEQFVNHTQTHFGRFYHNLLGNVTLLHLDIIYKLI